MLTWLLKCLLYDYIELNQQDYWGNKDESLKISRPKVTC